MGAKNGNTDIKESAKKVQNSNEEAEVVKEMEKTIKKNQCNIKWVAYQQDKIFERFKANDKFINLVNQFDISKSTVVFEFLL